MQPEQGSNRRAKLVSSNVFRVFVILGLVVGTGAALGAAVAYPLRSIDLTVRESVVLEHALLAGTFQPPQALVQPDDLSAQWQPADPGITDMLTRPICVSQQTTIEPVEAPLSRGFVNPLDSATLVSVAARYRSIDQAKERLGEFERNLTTCRQNEFLMTTTGIDGQSRGERFGIVFDRSEPLVADYVSRTIRPKAGGLVEVLIYFQVGDVIVGVDYRGPQTSNELFEKAETGILTRVAPQQFARTVDVSGAQPVPGNEVTTTTNAADPSPTSSPPTIAPPSTTAVSRPTVPGSTTTVKGKKSTSATTTTTRR